MEESQTSYASHAITSSAALAPMLSTAATRDFPDELLTTAGTPEVIARGQEADGYALAVSAYTWGYPLVRMERVMREYIDVPSPKPPTSYRAPLNKMGWATMLANPDAKDMPTANNEHGFKADRALCVDRAGYP